MAFPTKPLNPNTSATLSIPQFCLTGSKVDPELTQDVIDTGIQSAPGQSYGQLYPYQWVNWTQYQVGQYLYWLCGPISSNSGAIAYLQAGNFDSGVNIFNDSTLKFYDSSNTNYVGFKAPTLTSTSNYVLPSSIPIVSNKLLNTDLFGNLRWLSKNTMTIFSAQQSNVVWSPSSYLTNFFTSYYYSDLDLPSDPWNSSLGSFTVLVETLYKIQLNLTVQSQSSGVPTAGIISIIMHIDSINSPTSTNYVIYTQNAPANDVTFSINIDISLRLGDVVRFRNAGTLNLLAYQTFNYKNSLSFAWNL